jgi:hypothetical protein
MTMTLRTLGGLAAVLTACVFAAAQETSKDARPKSNVELVEAAKKSDPNLDFAKLRFSYPDTAKYDPYSTDRTGSKATAEAFAKKEYAKALEAAEAELKSNYVDCRAHMAAFRACTELKKAKQAKHHQYMLKGIAQSIVKSGDGKTPKSAFVVIDLEEENFILGVFGITKKRQGLMKEGERKIDRIDGVNDRGEPVAVHFDVSRQFRWMEQQFKQAK